MGVSRPNIEELIKKLDLEELIKALGHGDWRVRRDAASALVKIRDEKAVKPLLKKAVKPLINALKDENAEVRGWAAVALGGSFRGAAMDDHNERGWAFDEIRTKEVVESLIEAVVRDEDEGVRQSAVRALGSIPIPIGLEEGERIATRVDRVGGAPAPSQGFLLLTNKRLIYHGFSIEESFSLEIPLTEIINCDVKKPLFGKKKLVVAARRAIYKSLLKLVVEEVATHGFSQPPASVMKPKPLEFTNIEEVETLRSEIMSARGRA